MEKAQAEARAILDQARDTADQVFKELNDMRRRQRSEAKTGVDDNDERSDLRRRLNEAEERPGRPEGGPAGAAAHPARQWRATRWSS